MSVSKIDHLVIVKLLRVQEECQRQGPLCQEISHFFGPKTFICKGYRDSNRFDLVAEVQNQV